MILLAALSTEGRNKEIKERFEKERGKLFGFIRKRVNTEIDAEDILQDVFFQFISFYRDLEKIEKTSSWLFTVAKNKITDLYRKKKNVNFSELNKEEESGNSFEDNFADYGDTPDTIFSKGQFWERLNEVLNELPKDQKDVFMSHEMDGNSFKDISKRTGLPINTLISKKRYAVVALRKKLGGVHNDIISF